jgi:hypothetical protein
MLGRSVAGIPSVDESAEGGGGGAGAVRITGFPGPTFFHVLFFSTVFLHASCKN